MPNATAAMCRAAAARLERPGYFYPATILEHVGTGARVQHVEPFGPLAVLAEFDDLTEAIERANSLPYGLAAYAFTHDLAAAHRLSLALQAGMVGINHFGVSQPETPFGGVKDSGYGSESGLEGLLGYTDVKFVSVAYVITSPTARALLLDFGSVISVSAFERHRQTERTLNLPAHSLTWLGPLEPQTDALWGSMLRDEITERDYWATRARELGLAVGEAGWDMATLLARVQQPDPNALVRPDMRRLIRAARAAGILVAYCRTSSNCFTAQPWQNASTSCAT